MNFPTVASNCSIAVRFCTAVRVSASEAPCRDERISSAVAFIERKCESDASWRKAYHQGEAAQAVATNEYGIAYRVTIYKDGYVYADAPRVVPRPASPEDAAKAEAARKALIEETAEAARQAMERAALPPKVAEIFAARRAAAKTNEVTVTVGP